MRDLHTVHILYGRIPWEDKSSFLEIGLASHSLHLEVAETARVREDDERITL